jgi:hypothetical protein
MTTSLVDAQSVLAIDIGAINTRALLFDVVDGQYHFVAAAVMPTTVYAPYYDATEGLHLALNKLQEITGRAFLDDNANLIIPSNNECQGADRLVVTVSAGPELRMVTAGLLTDVSLDSAQRLAATTYGRVVDSVGLNDRRSTEVQIDAILRAKPDLVVIAGGADNGATRSVMKLIDLAALVCRLLPSDSRPEVVYTGNQALEKRVSETLGKWTRVHLAPNIRPSIDSEDLRPAQDTLATVISGLRVRQMGGLEPLAQWSSTPPLPTSHAFGRLIRILSRTSGAKGVLGVDLGANSTSLAIGNAGKLALHVLSPFGTGQGVLAALQGRLEDIIQWLPLHVPDESVRDAIWQKSFFPSLLPLTGEALAIEQAVARQLLRQALQQAAARWPTFNGGYDQVIASGAALTGAASPGQSLLMLLDALQPAGIVNFLLDVNHISPALGAISAFNALLPVQVMDTGAYLNLGTVISPVSTARYGTTLLKVGLDYGDGNVTRIEIKQGTLTVLPLAPGQAARLELEPQRRGVEIDPRRKDAARRYNVVGGACGLVIDARGRPLALPPDAPRRREMIKKWSLALN